MGRGDQGRKGAAHEREKGGWLGTAQKEEEEDEGSRGPSRLSVSTSGWAKGVPTETPARG